MKTFQIADTKSFNTINYHLKEIYDSGEIQPEATIRKFRIVQQEGAWQVAREVDFYNLDATIKYLSLLQILERIDNASQTGYIDTKTYTYLCQGYYGKNF